MPDFGLRTALNSLDHRSLRALDSFAIEDQTVHTRAQASRASGIQAFGLDVGKDILRAVTGQPRAEIPLCSVSGCEATLAVTVATDFRGLGQLCELLLDLYGRSNYRNHFEWVDNVSRVSDPASIDRLDAALLSAVAKPDASNIYLAPPEPVVWQQVQGFSFAHARSVRDPDMRLETYLRGLGESLDRVDTLQSHKVYMHGQDDLPPLEQWSVHKCIVFETSTRDETYVLTAGTWFEIDKSFARRIRRVLASIPASALSMPPVDQTDGRLESERDCNTRAAGAARDLALMDGKFAECLSAGDRIEFCDLISSSGHVIHVKHRKGGC